MLQVKVLQRLNVVLPLLTLQPMLLLQPFSFVSSGLPEVAENQQQVKKKVRHMMLPYFLACEVWDELHLLGSRENTAIRLTLVTQYPRPKIARHFF